MQLSLARARARGRRQTLPTQSRLCLFCPGDLQHLRLAPPSNQPVGERSERVVVGFIHGVVSHRKRRPGWRPARDGEGRENYLELGNAAIYVALLDRRLASISGDRPGVRDWKYRRHRFERRGAARTTLTQGNCIFAEITGARGERWGGYIKMELLLKRLIIRAREHLRRRVTPRLRESCGC